THVDDLAVQLAGSVVDDGHSHDPSAMMVAAAWDCRRLLHSRLLMEVGVGGVKVNRNAPAGMSEGLAPRLLPSPDSQDLDGLSARNGSNPGLQHDEAIGPCGVVEIAGGLAREGL